LFLIGHASIKVHRSIERRRAPTDPRPAGPLCVRESSLLAAALNAFAVLKKVLGCSDDARMRLDAILNTYTYTCALTRVAEQEKNPEGAKKIVTFATSY